MKHIIEQIAKDKLIDQIISNVAKDAKDEDLKDLKQDIYLILMEKDEDFLEGIYERGQMPYYLSRIITNNINSKTSRFYYLYKVHKNKQLIIDDIPNEPTEEPKY